MPGIVVLGIGQSLRGDDAAGLEAVRLWQESYPQSAARIRVELSELPGLALLDLLEGAEAAVLVEAVHADVAPGMLIRLWPEDLASFGSDARSAHGWGVAETLRLGRSLNPLLAQCRVNLIGIVGRDFTLGAGLGPQVRLALDDAAGAIEREIQDLLK